MTQTINRKLYDLVGRDDRRMSPFCWRAKLALAHKGLEAEIIPMKFTEKDMIAFSGQEQVPVLVDDKEVLSDSWRIACYLEETYPERPSLFGDSGGRNLTRVLNHWFDSAVVMALFPLVLPDNYDVIDPADADYYKESREAWTGRTREQLEAERSEEKFIEWRESLEPIRSVLAEQAYLGGESPLFSDYIVFSMFMWARAVSPWPIIKPDDVLYPWRENMLDLYDGMPRKSVGYHY